ncbi:MAG: signal peptide peptidase SppA [Syntrophobacterales bacterium]|jgi:protease-4|nr:signal peptide peptidase SppA [Syntrophobacterales bacterium]
MKKHSMLLGVLLLFVVGIVALILMKVLLGGGKYSLASEKKLAIVKVEGAIGNSEEIVRQLSDLTKDDRVKAIVVRIDSVGGGVAPSQEIYEAILAAGKQKKVVASMGSVAASGGYLIACGAEQIVANPGTVTGSISAVMHFTDIQELMKKIGVHSSVVKSGKYKDIGSSMRDMTEEERILLQELVDDVYEQLLEVISVRRKISMEKLKQIADGRILTGRQALKLKLIDSLGTQQDAVRIAAKLAGLPENPDIIYAERRKSLFLDFLLGSLANRIKNDLLQNAQDMGGLKFLYYPEQEVIP